jgi:hypothetical protein
MQNAVSYTQNWKEVIRAVTWDNGCPRLSFFFINVEFVALISKNNIPCGVTELFLCDSQLFLCDSQFTTVFIQFNIGYYGTVRFSAVKKLALNKQKSLRVYLVILATQTAGWFKVRFASFYWLRLRSAAQDSIWNRQCSSLKLERVNVSVFAKREGTILFETVA